MVGPSCGTRAHQSREGPGKGYCYQPGEGDAHGANSRSGGPVGRRGPGAGYRGNRLGGPQHPREFMANASLRRAVRRAFASKAT